MKSYRAIAILPAFNESKNIRKVIEKTKKQVSKVLVVDDGSSDNTSSIARKAGADVIRLEKNSGVGYASRIGLKKAIKEKYDIIVFLDADGQLDPKYITQFIEKVKEGYDYVYGRRNLYKYQLNRIIGNWGLTFLTNLICPTGILDIECGYRAIPLRTAKKLKLKAMGYEREVDFIYEVWRNKLKVSYVKVTVPVFHPKSRLRAMLRGTKNFLFFLKRRIGLI